MTPTLKNNSTAVDFSPDNSTNTTRALFALLLRAGYILIQIGTIPTENVHRILLHNIIDISVCICSYCFLGYVIAFGSIFEEIVWIGSNEADLNDAIYGLSVVLISTAIVTTFLTGRLHVIAVCVVGGLHSGVIEPLILHWRLNTFRKIFLMGYVVSIKDTAGGITIHVTSSIVGLIGAVFLGRRLLKLRDIDESSIGVGSPGTTCLGYLLVLIGFIAFTTSPVIIINNLIALSGATLTLIVLTRSEPTYWNSLRCFQASISGIVCVASGVDIYHPLIVFCISIFAACLYYLTSELIQRTFIEDYSNLVAVHMVNGFLSALLPALLGHNENVGLFSVPFPTAMVDLSWQLACALCVIALVSLLFTLVFWVLSVIGLLRNESETVAHQRAVNANRKNLKLLRTFKVKKTTPLFGPGEKRSVDSFF